MIEITGIIVVVALLAILNIVAFVVAAIWISFGLWAVSQSRSRGFVADFGFVFGAPIYWVIER